jgi:hypothetical protein
MARTFWGARAPRSPFSAPLAENPRLIKGILP